MPTDKEQKALNKAVEWAGNKYKLAQLLGVKHQNFVYWQNSQVPVLHALKIHSLSKGKIKAYDLNADIPREIFAR